MILRVCRSSSRRGSQLFGQEMMGHGLGPWDRTPAAHPLCSAVRGLKGLVGSRRAKEGAGFRAPQDLTDE